MRIFISSVRAGLETERDALPGLITALGHTAVRFEDFSAQPVPSREACLAGVDSSDVYLLLLGPRNGHRFSDTGQSATHDEWVAATAVSLPRLVYRKQGVQFEPDQADFARQIEDYGSGVFRDSFMAVQDLQTKVVAKIRELEQADSPLASRSWLIRFPSSGAESSVMGAAVQQRHRGPYSNCMSYPFLGPVFRRV